MTTIEYTEHFWLNNKMNKVLLVLTLLFLFSGCAQNPAIVQIIQILDESNNSPIEEVDISISSAEIPGRGKDDLTDWD